MSQDCSSKAYIPAYHVSELVFPVVFLVVFPVVPFQFSPRSPMDVNNNNFSVFQSPFQLELLTLLYRAKKAERRELYWEKGSELPQLST